ncbi:unnamed protein product [Penicillium glandicola]
MAPSEESILSNFLLSPAPLPTVREQDMDRVNESIDNEIKQGEKQRAELRKAILATGVEASNSEQREMDMDLHLFGQPPTVPGDYHSVASLLAEMETASANIEHEIAGIDQEAAKILAQLNTTVGDMSDLRYGKLQGPASTAEDVASEAIKGLQNLEDVCYKSSTS